jgi:hypothetical protein
VKPAAYLSFILVGRHSWRLKIFIVLPEDLETDELKGFSLMINHPQKHGRPFASTVLGIDDITLESSIPKSIASKGPTSQRLIL